ncbi:MAG TPA: DUF2304 domain-containing protein [Vicinamibacteria bacterium]|nr:DUF2304 domain-containing protein [Vicinamibacteria bacterium]
MPIRQTAVFLTIALLLLVVIVELVRRRRLRVEYAWLWIAAGLTNVLLILRYDLLVGLTEAVGAVIPTSTLFFLCILYLALLSLNYSVRLSELTRHVKELAQEVALLRAEAAARPTPDRGLSGEP